MAKMKVTVVGHNALSTLLASNLARAKNDVWVLDANPQIIKKIDRDSVKVEGQSGSYKTRLKATTDPKEIGLTETVFICSRSYETESTLQKIKDIIAKNTCIVSLQNGLGNLQLINEYIDSNNVIGAITSHDASLLDDNYVRHNEKGETILGQENSRVLGIIRDISTLLTKASFPTKISKDINSAMWSKLIIDVALNALGAITRLKNGSLLKTEPTREMLRRAVTEASKIAKRKKIKLAYDDPIQKVETVCRTRPDAISPMLEDVLSKRMTEIDFINGAIVRHGKSLNIKTPTNEMLTELVKAIESNYDSLVNR
ncbi:MAG: 2-dehydropantoate 2-reductase [Candidatus Omnitrophica bacterium]|nr:2-dehydropantoate 2-reductase [Candidatus Omnitrophota bacterium]